MDVRYTREGERVSTIARTVAQYTRGYRGYSVFLILLICTPFPRVLGSLQYFNAILQWQQPTYDIACGFLL